MRSLLICLCLLLLTIQSHATPQFSGIGEKKTEVFLQSTWHEVNILVTNLREWAQGSWHLDTNLVIEGAIFPIENDSEGLSRAAMLRTTVRYDPSLLFGLSANQSFEHGLRLQLGSEWKPMWANGLSFNLFYRLNRSQENSPIGISSTTKLNNIEIECAYNKGIASHDRDAVQLSIGMPLEALWHREVTSKVL
jgi:hypothetical protein